MTTSLDERDTLLARLRDMVSARMTDSYRDAPLDDLRHYVAACEESLRIYASLGLVDESRQTPPPQGKAA
jgi:hypothetical protein